MQEEKLKKIKISVFILGAILIFFQNLMATINYSPSQPNVDQNVTFTVTNPNGIAGNKVQWNFGDGTPLQWGPTVMNKVFTAKGTFTVRATYRTNKQQQITDQRTITVVERRKISFNPFRPYIGKPVTFTAQNFLAATIRWDFGDQTVINNGSTVETHVYTKPGTYIVRAWDWSGNTVNPISTTVTVFSEIRGPRAPFSISFIQIRFEDGKSYKVIPKDFAPLISYADIKYEGTGILRAQWIMDGKPFRFITQSLPFARDTIINSGKIPGLPTQIPGIHEVTLRIIEPQVEYAIPVIRYFVPLKVVEREKAVIRLLKVTSLDGIEIPVTVDTIGIPAEGYFLVKGSIKSINESLIPFAVLRIYLDSELVDQQLIRNLKPRQEIEFETSIHNASSLARRIYITLYDISRKPPVLLYLKRLNLVFEF